MTDNMIELESKRPLDLKEMTDARVALGRFGAGQPTKAALAFLLDHARAREAVWSEVDRASMETRLSSQGFETVRVDSEAGDRSTYVRRPDLGRRLSAASMEQLQACAKIQSAPDVVIVIADGLSSSAVEINAPRLVEELAWRLRAQGLSIGPIVLAGQARVALGDPVGEVLGARLTIMLIGERPGLSAADSLGAYVTYGPRRGTPDSRRNCISNIRDGGLDCLSAASAIGDLVASICKTGTSGVALKDASAQVDRLRFGMECQ
ncbi:ethanolamine ammonia-lyase small subunit [Ochrobactrum intermedium]|uniref:Ethanolamine ammonia-lyase small subunit n=1 Tax=Brucella intermedia TaxID=94625 RepID=A0ABR6AVT5_9HYPH|nr:MULTISPECIES: ethanolamine ammonia-lyase subunit EutC [Brucella]MBA8853580.1 ethanolamine ammonia-lyase small subunit [Brucella intermedia]